ncbi:MAG: AsmA family protein [Candidatus Nitronauta litoralis]|uniref:AsmA family protein n=1 Tax=Candidatus Nitronauta litoralis TaxID=2705533 RepID=A0A7T0G0J4_9BACT|nr:MAG: AsmA family protein [Candidatus Nitronauta litoralis]
MKRPSKKNPVEDNVQDQETDPVEGTSEESVNPPPKQVKKKRSFLRSLFRWTFSLLLMLVLIVVGLGAILTHFFPSEEIRPIAEDQLTTHLKMPVKIGRLEFNLLTGFEFENVQLGGTDPLFKVDLLILGYDLLELIDGSFTVHTLKVNRPHVNLISKNGVWNFQPLLDLAGPAQPPPPEPSGMPVIPIPVELTELVVNDIEVNVQMDDVMTAHLKGLNLEARGKADTNGLDVNVRVHMGEESREKNSSNVTYVSSLEPAINLLTYLDTDITLNAQDINRALVTGTLGLTDTRVTMKQRLKPVNTRLDFAAGVDMASHILDLSRVKLKVANGTSMSLTGQVQRFLSPHPGFNLKIPKGDFDLNELTALAKPFLPPMILNGQLGLTDVQIRGGLRNYQPANIFLTKATIKLDNGLVRHPLFKTQLNGVGLGLDIKNVKVKGLVPYSMETNGELKMTSGEFAGFYFEQLTHKFDLKGTGPLLPKMVTTYKTELETFTMDLPQVGEITTPIKLQGNFKGDTQTGDIESFTSALEAGTALTSKVSLQAKAFGKKGFKMDQSFTSDLSQASRFIPPDMTETFGLGPLKGEMRFSQKASGSLDKDFMPVNMTADTNVQLIGLDAEMKEPAFSVKGLSTRLSIPVEMKKKLGVRLPGVVIKTSLDSVHALGKYQAGATEMTSTISLDKFLSLDGNVGRVPVTKKTTFKSEGIVGIEPDIKVSRIDLEVNSRADVLPPGEAENMTATGKLAIKGIEAMGQFAASGFNTAFNMDAKDLNLQKTHAAIKGRVLKPSVQQEDLQMSLEDLQFETRSSQNLKSGDVDLGLLSVVLPGVVNWKTKGKIESWGDQFDVETRMDKMDLEKLLALVPAKFKEAIKGMKVAGSASLVANAKGKRPDEIAIKKMDIPVTVDSKLKLAGVTVDWPEKAMVVEGLDFDTELTLKNNKVDLKGASKVAHFTKTDLGYDLKLAPELAFHYAIKNWDTLEVEQHKVSLPGQEIEQTLSGRVEGFRPFLSGKKDKTPIQILKTLDVALKSSLGLDVGAVSPLVPGLQADGKINSHLDIKLIAGQQADLNGEVDIGHLNARHESGGIVEDLDGRFLINKTLLLDRLLFKEKKQFNASRQGFFNQLREFSRYKNIFKIGALKFGQHTASDIGIDMYYRGNQLFLDRFLMEVMGGSVAGNLFLSQSKEGPELEFSTGFAHLDFNKLVKKQVTPSGRDSEIDGNLKFNFKVNQGGGKKISLDQIGAEMNITHVGKEALDRILLFLDPEESSPAIVDTRSKLDLAVPTNLHMKVAHGNLNMDVGMILLGSPIEAPALRRVPVTSLKHFRQINEQLQRLKDFQTVLQILSANGIEFDDEGNISFF